MMITNTQEVSVSLAHF